MCQTDKNVHFSTFLFFDC